MIGTDKKRVFVIGKLQKPYSFKNGQKLLVEYAAINTAWMTLSSFNSVFVEQVWEENYWLCVFVNCLVCVFVGGLAGRRVGRWIGGWVVSWGIGG